MGPPLAAGKRDRLQPARLRVLQAREHVRGRAARRNADRDIAGPSKRLDLPHEDAIEAVVVGDRRHGCRVGGQRHRRPARDARAETARPARTRSAARPPRCRRCRKSAPSLHCRTPASMQFGNGDDGLDRFAAPLARAAAPHRAASSSTASTRSSAIKLRSSRRVRARGFVSREVRAKFLFGHLQRLLGARPQANLHGEILPQRITFPLVRHQQPAQIAVVFEDDAEHVPRFALEPARGRPHALHGRQPRRWHRRSRL